MKGPRLMTVTEDQWRANYEAALGAALANHHLRMALTAAREFIAHHPAVRGDWPVVLDAIDRALARESSYPPEPCVGVNNVLREHN